MPPDRCSLASGRFGVKLETFTIVATCQFIPRIRTDYCTALTIASGHKQKPAAGSHAFMLDNHGDGRE